MIEIMRLATYAAQIMLKNGAETYRVEDTIERICATYKLTYIETFVTPTGIFISINDDDENHEGITSIKRIKDRDINLSKISKVNDFSRQFVSTDLSVEEGMAMLKAIDKSPNYNFALRLLSAGLASGCFGILLGSDVKDFFWIAITGVIVIIAMYFYSLLKMNKYLGSALGAMIAAIFAIIFTRLGVGYDIDKIVISSIMILVPGVAITNAVRDLISGDLVSGMARILEAIIIAIFIAVGVGIVFEVWNRAIGGVNLW